MRSILSVIAFVLIVVGVVLWLVANHQRTDKNPRMFWYKPRYWRPVWRMQDWFTPAGFRINLIGTGLVCFGCLLALVAQF